MVTVLGFYGHYNTIADHEPSACIVQDGKILAAIEEDRITRIKHDGRIPPWNSIKEVMRLSNVMPDEIDAVAIPWESPSQKWLKGIMSNPLKVNRYFSYPYYKVLSKKFMDDVMCYFGIKAPINYINHHESHAANAFLTSGLKDATVITMDGAGDRLESLSVWDVKDGNMKRLSVTNAGTFGTFYAVATKMLGFNISDGEGKTMGLASYSKPNEHFDDWLNVDGLKVRSRMKDDSIMMRIDVNDRKVFASYRYLIDKYNKQLNVSDYISVSDIASSAQKELEDKCVRLVRNAIINTYHSDLCLSGGVVLNMKLNKKIREMSMVNDVYIFPNPGDSGVCVGAALQVCQRLSDNFKSKRMRHTYYGTEYTDEEILKAIEEYRFEYQRLRNPEKTAAKLVSEGKVVGWFQDRLEFGPRALGNRSVIADPRDAKIKDKINNHLKKRDWFMPFAPSILDEAKDEYMVDAVEAPFMIMGFDTVEDKIREIPAVVHVDGTIRPQTVIKDVNPKYWKVINEFKKITGVPVVLNTSFNRHGQPMVRSPEDAMLHVVWGCVEYLVIGDYLIDAKVVL